MFKFFKNFFNEEETIPVNETEKNIKYLIDFLLKNHPLPQNRNVLSKHIKEYHKSTYKKKLDKLPWIYLLIEKEILDNTASDNISTDIIRKKISQAFPELLKLPQFNLIFLPTKIQEAILCRTLLKGVLDRSLNVLGHFKDTFLAEIHIELDKPLDYIDEDIDVLAQRKKLLTISKEIFYLLKGSLGESAVLNVYHSTYKEYFGNYYLLDAFTATLNIVPEDILTQEMVDLPSKHQMHKMLQQQVNSLEVINSRLTREVVERKKAEESLKESENLKSTILETAMDAVILFDENLIINDWNKEASIIFEWTKKEAINTHLSKIISPKAYSFIHKAVLNFLKVEKAKFINKRIEIVTPTKSGNEIDIEVAVRPIKTSNGYLFNAFARNITQQKKYQQELKLAKENAEKSAKAKSVFLSNMSHEIRTPLNVILGLTSIIQKESAVINSQINDNIEGVKFSAENLLALVNDVLDFSSIEAGKTIINLTHFNIHQFIENLKISFEPKAKELGLLFKIHKDDSIPEKIIGDPYRLNQILTNLISNALKFTNKGRVNLLLETIQIKQDKVSIRFTIKDTGIGIPENQLQQVFDSFYQVHEPGKNKIEGTGLGLAITKELIELQGGSLKVHSIADIGSEFKFELDFEISQSNQIGKNEDLDKTIIDSIKNYRILVAEDNKLNQLFIGQLLKQWDTKVTFANNGIDAHSLHIKNSYDIILMDLHMPEMDGFDATKAIRRTDTKTPIIACSADVFEASRKKAFNAGVNYYITKPIKEEILKNILAKALFLDSKITEDIQPVNNPTKVKEDTTLLNLEFLISTFQGNKDFIKSVLEIFINETPSDYELLNLQIQKKQYKEAGNTAHKIKSSFRTLGITKMSPLLEEIELKTKNNEQLESIPDILNTTLPIYLQSISEVKHLLSSE